MTTYIFDFDSRTAKFLYQDGEEDHGRLLWSITRFQSSMTEEQFFEYLAQEIEIIFVPVKGKRLILRANSRDRKRLERHLSANMKNRLVHSPDDRLAG